MMGDWVIILDEVIGLSFVLWLWNQEINKSKEIEFLEWELGIFFRFYIFILFMWFRQLGLCLFIVCKFILVYKMKYICGFMQKFDELECI